MCKLHKSNAAMKTPLLPVLACAAALGHAFAADPLQEALQQGLLEEDVNHNLDAAIAAYQTVVTQYDAQRQAAATALFRLAECLRKQGKTNEAVAHYQRVLRDFADQSRLVELSRPHVPVSPRPTPDVEPVGAPDAPLASVADQLEAEALRAQAEAQFLKEQFQKYKGMGLDYVTRVMLTESNDALLQSLYQARATTEQREAELEVIHGADHPELLQIKAILSRIDRQIQERASSYLAALKMRAELSEAKAASLRQAAEQARRAPAAEPQTGATASSQATAAVPLEDEAAELHRLQRMVQDSPDLFDLRDDAGFAPLHYAAEKGQLTVARFLLDHGVAVDRRSKGNETPLHRAALKGQKAMVQFLLGRGADVQAKDAQGQTALHLAAYRGFVAVAQALLDGGADANATDDFGLTPLHAAAWQGHPAVARLLITRGANVNAQVLRQGPQRFSTGETPLHLAARSGQQTVAEVLVASGARLDAPAEGGSPLAVAIEARQPNVAQWLLHQCARAGIRDAAADSLLLRVLGSLAMPGIRDARPALSELVQPLLDHGADPNARDSSGATALMRAAQLRRADLVKLLLERRADVNARDEMGWTALHYAVARAAKEIVTLLLAHGADVNLADNSGQTPLSLVVTRHPGMVGGTPSPPVVGLQFYDPQQATPRSTESAEIVDLLRQHGATEPK